MKINTNIGLRDRSRITLGGFKGLDTLSVAVDVSAIHATEMQNLISRDGVNHKRYGWKTQFRIRQGGKFLKIQGVFDFTIFGINFLIAYAGKSFWLLDKGTKDYKDITLRGVNLDGTVSTKSTSISPVQTDLLEDRKCEYFVNGNKVYFIGCGDYLVFSKWDNKLFELRRVAGNEDVHIPTTTENIGCEEDGKHYTRVTAEERNILSPYTYNLLFGRTNMTSTDKATYYLDTTRFIGLQVEITHQNDNKTLLTSSGYIDANTEDLLGHIILSGNKKHTFSTAIKTITYEEQEQISQPIMFYAKNTINTGGDEFSIRYCLYANEEFVLENCSEVKVSLNVAGDGVRLSEENIQASDFVVEEYMPIQDCPCKYIDVYLDASTSATDIQLKIEYSYNDNGETKYFSNISNKRNYAEILCKALDDYITREDENMINILSNRLCMIGNFWETIKSEIATEIQNLSLFSCKNDVQILLKSELVGAVNEELEQTANYTGKVVLLLNEEEIELSTISYNGLQINCSYKSGGEFHISLTLSLPELDMDLTQYNLTLANTENDVKIYNINKFFLKNLNNQTCGEVDTRVGKLILYYIDANFYAPIVADTPNIKVRIFRTNDFTSIIKTTKACKFGAQGGTDRLFIVDNTGHTVRWSKDEDFTYFGEKSWCVCGTSDKSITGMDRLNDSTLLIVKEYSPREPSIFIITGNIMTGETEAGTVDYTALFTPHGYQVGMGAVGEIVNFNGDCIMVGKDGLYAVSLGENMTVDSRYVLHRSRQISNKLEKFDLANAKCVSFNGKFFVAVGGEEQECYIADNKYTASFEGDIQNVVNYEWWRWTNIPVNVWGFVGNELWFGTNDGQLCCFTENFYDETFSRLHTSLAIYEMEENEIVGFTLHKDIKVSIGDVFTPTCDFYGGITTNKFECADGETKFYLPLNDYLDGEKIYIDNTAYTITKHDLYFSIPYTTESTELTIYRNYKNKPLTVMDDVVIVLKDRDNKFPKWSSVIANGGLNPANDAFTATLSHKEPVVSKWVSGAMDLGTRVYSKTLTYLVLTGEKDLANRLKYGLKTRFTHRDYELLRANNDLDFTELDLQTVSMDSDFASSYTKKLNIRNINFLTFYFVSDAAEDVALNSIQFEFKLCKRNIGVR